MGIQLKTTKWRPHDMATRLYQLGTTQSVVSTVSDPSLYSKGDPHKYIVLASANRLSWQKKHESGRTFRKNVGF